MRLFLENLIILENDIEWDNFSILDNARFDKRKYLKWFI